MFNFKKTLSIILSSVIVASFAAGCSQAQTNSDNTSDSGKPKLVMGLDDSFPPMGFRDESNNIVGFDVDVAQAVCDELGWELVPQPIKWQNKEMEINNGNVDVLWNGFSWSEERAEALLLSDPYLENNQIIVVTKDSDIKSKADLEGKKVAMQKDSTAETAFNEDPIAQKVGEAITFSDNVSALNDLKIGRTDAVIVDEVVANYYATKDDSFVVINDSFVSENYVIGFKKGNEELKDKVMGAFDKLAEDGTLSEISEKWFGKDIVIK